MPLPVIAILGIIQGALVLKNTSVGFNKFIEAYNSNSSTKEIIDDAQNKFNTAIKKIQLVQSKLNYFRVGINIHFSAFANLMEKIQSKPQFADIQMMDFWNNREYSETYDINTISTMSTISLASSAALCSLPGIGLLCGDFLFNKTCSNIKSEAETNSSIGLKIKKAQEEQCYTLDKIYENMISLYHSFTKIFHIYYKLYIEMKEIVERHSFWFFPCNFNSFNDKEKTTLKNLCLLVQVINKWCKVDIL